MIFSNIFLQLLSSVESVELLSADHLREQVCNNLFFSFTLNFVIDSLFIPQDKGSFLPLISFSLKSVWDFFQIE